MKHQFLFSLLFAIVFLVSCDSQTSTGSKDVSSDTVPGKSDTSSNKFNNAWKGFPNAIQNSVFVRRYEVPLDPRIVDECIKEYRDKLGATPPNASNVLFTYSVAFDTRKFETWLNDGVFTNSDELRMEFGIYSDAAIALSRQIYSGDPSRQIPSSHRNKTTVFVSPYMSGSRSTNLEPFNLGSLHP